VNPAKVRIGSKTLSRKKGGRASEYITTKKTQGKKGKKWIKRHGSRALPCHPSEKTVLESRREVNSDALKSGGQEINARTKNRSTPQVTCVRTSAGLWGGRGKTLMNFEYLEKRKKYGHCLDLL